MSDRIPASFLNHAAEILADTSRGLSGSKIVEYCNARAVDCNVDPPHSTYPFDAPNKRTALQQNLAVFSPKDQYEFLLDLCDRFGISTPDEVKQLRSKIIKRFGPQFSDHVMHTANGLATPVINSASTPLIVAPINRPLRVFLCHASEDKPQVRELYHKLKRDGFSPWLDEEDLIAGQDWQLEIRRAVKIADVVLVCLSTRSTIKSGFVQKEIRIALDVADEQPEGVIFVVPIRLEVCDVPDRLSQRHWVDEFTPDGYTQICRALRERVAALALNNTAKPTAPNSGAEPQHQTVVVALDLTLKYIPGWEAVRTRLAKRIKHEFGDEWRVTIVPIPDDMLAGLEEGCVPYPKIVPQEKRMIYYTFPDGLSCDEDIRYTVESIYDFLLQFKYPDEV